MLIKTHRDEQSRKKQACLFNYYCNIIFLNVSAILTGQADSETPEITANVTY